jgi:hypothetical protein
LLVLLCDLAELALPLRAEAAESEFLHAVRDSSHQQFAAEMRRCLGFVKSANADARESASRQAVASWMARRMPAPDGRRH